MESSRTLVSVIVPCYNQTQYLPEALGSVLLQSYPHWECIIVNDGSPDNVEEVAQQWISKDARFKYIKKENGGLSSARNAGLKVASGEFIQLLDADDLLEVDKIQCQILFLDNNNEDIDIVVSGYRYFFDSDEKRELLIYGPSNILPEVAVSSSDKKDFIKLFARTNPMVISSPLYRRRVFQKIGLFDEALGALEDWDFHFRCAINGIVFQHNGYPPSSRALIRIHDRSMSTDRSYMISNLRRFRQKHKNNYEFALENDLMITDFRKSIYPVVKMFIPPFFIWLVKRILRIV